MKFAIAAAIAISLAIFPALFDKSSAQAAETTGLSITQICTVAKAQAQKEGFNKVTCEGGSFNRTAQNLVPTSGRERHIRLTLTPDRMSVVVDTVDVELKGKSSANSVQSMALAASIPSQCYVALCDASVSRKIEVKHLFGLGPNCAWINFVQRYRVYYPWRVMVDVQTPSVSSGAWFPCNEDSRNSWINRDNLPWWAESGASIHWKVGIPTPWGVVGVREFNPSIGLYFNGAYEAHWE